MHYNTILNRTKSRLSLFFPESSLQKQLVLWFYRGFNKIFFKGELSNEILYSNWIYTNEILFTEDDSIDTLITLITPIFNTPPKVIKQTIDSVLQQTYPNWEWCLVNASLDQPELNKILEDAAAADKRIKLKNLPENRGIAANTNAAIDMAQGEFITFLDHDDTLAPDALQSVVEALQTFPESDVFYSDEDKISADGGKRFDPFFKPAFSLPYLRSINYMCHFLVVRKSLGDSLGWLRPGFEGAQDFDLILHCVEKARKVTHIPRVLYHWRAMPGSTALNIHAKEYATQSGLKAVREHIQRLGLEGQVMEGPVPTSYRVSFVLPQKPLVSIIIPNHNHAGDLKQCVESILFNSTYQNIEVLIVENHSTEAAVFKLYENLQNEDTRVRLIKDEDVFNYSKVNNRAVLSARGEILLFLNNDTRVINADWLERMLEYTLQPQVGAVGAKLLYPDNTVQHAGVIVGIGGFAGHPHKKFKISSLGHYGRLVFPQNYLAVTAACLMIRRDVFEEIGGFDEAFALAAGDVDLCLKIHKKGYQIIWTPYAELYHYESKTRGYEDTAEKKARFEKEKAYFLARWGELLAEGDPYYNPNLSLNREDFSIEPHARSPHPRAINGLINDKK